MGALIIPIKNEREKYRVQYDVKDLERLYHYAKDNQLFGRIVSEYAHNTHRSHLFWDTDLSSIGRTFSRLNQPFVDFFTVVMSAQGDIEVDRRNQET